MALFSNKKTTNETKAPKEEAAVSMKDLYSETAVKTTKKGAAKVKKAGNHEISYRLLIKPLVTEKASNLGTENKYIFVVAKQANKITVAKAVEATYGVKPLNVNIINVEGKKVTRGRISGQRSDYKKAIVTLKKGDVIKVYEGV